MRCSFTLVLLLLVVTLSGCGSKSPVQNEESVAETEDLESGIADNIEYEAIINNGRDASRDFIIFESDSVSFGNEHGGTLIVQKGEHKIEKAGKAIELLTKAIGDSADYYASQLIAYINENMSKNYGLENFVCGVCRLDEEIARGKDGRFYGTSYGSEDEKTVIVIGCISDDCFCGGWSEVGNEDIDLQLPVLEYRPVPVETFEYQIIEKE